MHERWYFSFHSTALGLCPVYFLFGVAKVLCWLPWQFIPSQTHLNYPKDNMLNTQCCCPFPHISAALGRFFLISIKCSVYFYGGIILLVKVQNFWNHGVLETPGLGVTSLIRQKKKKKRNMSHDCTVMYVDCNHYVLKSLSPGENFPRHSGPFFFFNPEK